MKISANNSYKWSALLILSCLVGLIVRLTIIIQPAEIILERYGSDDLFYYTETAKNVVAGNGISFDGIHPTSGVQPLWTVALLPFAQWFENPSIGLRAALILASFFALLTALLLPKVLVRVLSKNGLAIGAIAGSIWMLHPKILQVSFEGTEGSLAALAWLFSFWAWVSARESSKYYTLGFVLGLGILARVDHLVLAAMLWLFPLQNIKGLVRKGLQMLPGIAILFGGWLIICWLTTGEFGLDSGKVKRLHFLRMLALENNFPIAEVGSLSLIAEQAKGWVMNGITYLSILLHAESRVSITLLAVLALGVGVLANGIKIQQQSVRVLLETTWQLISKLNPIFLAAPFVFLAYLVYLHYLRSWYLIPLFLCGTLVGATVFFDLFIRNSDQSQKRGMIISSFFFVTFAMMHVEAHLNPRKGVDPALFSAIDQVKTEIDPGATIGAFNAGIAGAWFSPDHVVVNLDGVINHSVGQAIESRRLDEYVLVEKVDYLFDFNGSIGFFGKIGSNGLDDNLILKNEFVLSEKDSVRVGLWKVDDKRNGR